jgi:hypothetical protein
MMHPLPFPSHKHSLLYKENKNMVIDIFVTVYKRKTYL